jgi:hypothetical protein
MSEYFLFTASCSTGLVNSSKYQVLVIRIKLVVDTHTIYSLNKNDQVF